MTGHPAISVPAGVTPDGVPFGLEITAPRFRDGMALTAAEAGERTNPWPLRRSRLRTVRPRGRGCSRGGGARDEVDQRVRLLAVVFGFVLAADRRVRDERAG